MSPKPLVDEAGEDLEVTLLNAAREYRPSGDSKTKTMVALGIGTTAMVGTSKAAGAGLLTAGVWKLLGITAVVGGLGIAGVAAIDDAPAPGEPTAALHRAPQAGQADRQPAAAVALPAESRETDPAPEPRAEPEADLAEPEAASAPEPDVAPAARALVPPPSVPTPMATPRLVADPSDPAAPLTKPRTAPKDPTVTDPPTPAPTGRFDHAAPPPPKAPKLTDEVAELDRAKRALRDGRSAEALAALKRYRKKFSNGVMTAEATVMRIEALLKRGDRERARAVGRQFLAKHPNSVHADKVRSLTR